MIGTIIFIGLFLVAILVAFAAYVSIRNVSGKELWPFKGRKKDIEFGTPIRKLTAADKRRLEMMDPWYPDHNFWMDVETRVAFGILEKKDPILAIQRKLELWMAYQEDRVVPPLPDLTPILSHTEIRGMKYGVRRIPEVGPQGGMGDSGAFPENSLMHEFQEINESINESFDNLQKIKSRPDVGRDFKGVY